MRIDASSVSNNYYLDLGDGVYGSPGQNSIYSNGVKDVQNAGGGTIQAQSNWWGRTPPINSQFQGSINRANWLTFDPNGP